MKRIIIISLFVILFLVGCKEEQNETMDKEIFTSIESVEEIVVTKYLNNINDYECKYYLKGQECDDLIVILKSLKGRETLLGGGDGLYKYSFTIGALKICVANDLCRVNNDDYRIDYDFNTFFEKFEGVIDNSEYLFGEIVDTENVSTIDIIRVNADLSETTMFLREDDKIGSFLENVNASKWNVVEESDQKLIYKLKISKTIINIFISEAGEYYMKANDKFYKTNGTFEFLDSYTKENTDDNSSGWLPWV